MSLQELVRHWAHVAVDSGADGIILPGNVLSEVADLTVEKLNPGVRRTKDQKTASAQKQVSTPFENVVAGANLLVVGSPIYGDENPVESLAYFLSEMKRGQDYLEQQNDRI
jgi:orotidine-5'-phosphate decarboxylase